MTERRELRLTEPLPAGSRIVRAVDVVSGELPVLGWGHGLRAETGEVMLVRGRSAFDDRTVVCRGAGRVTQSDLPVGARLVVFGSERGGE